jgi:hypothetical protein
MRRCPSAWAASASSLIGRGGMGVVYLAEQEASAAAWRSS